MYSRPSTKTTVLSKSTFIRGCKCLKSLYLYKHHYDLRDETSAAQQAIFDQGHQIGELARSLFPGGKDASVVPAYKYFASVAATQALLNANEKVIYEAGFLYNNVYAAADILVIKPDGWYVYEVKSTTSVKDYHYLDAAVQLYILRGLQLPVRAIHVVHINNQYVKRGAIDPVGLFTIADVTEEALAYQAYVIEQLRVMTNALQERSVPNMDIGPQCAQYYSCDFESYCWQRFDGVEFPVHTISRIGDKVWPLINDGILCQTQIPENFSLTENQKVQVRANQEKAAPPPNVDGITDFLSAIQYPIGFLDFESFYTAVPLFDNTRPYQQVPFQYSIHTISQEGEMQHYEFLGDGKCDPRKGLVEQMIGHLDGMSCILCYNVPFERKRIEELMEEFPECKEALQEILDKLVDLIVPFRKKYVYHYKMNGSASIKDVLPALLPHLSYEDLEIKEGGSASQAYLDLFTEKNEDKINKVKDALLAYCKMDTYAMVELFQYLRNITILN